jgi:hypothetical protein
LSAADKISVDLINKLSTIYQQQEPFTQSNEHDLIKMHNELLNILKFRKSFAAGTYYDSNQLKSVIDYIIFQENK